MKWKDVLMYASLVFALLLIANVILVFRRYEIQKLKSMLIISRTGDNNGHSTYNVPKGPVRVFSEQEQTCKPCASLQTNTSLDKVYDYFTGKYSLDKPAIKSWVSKENTWTFCNNRITIYNDLFAILHDVTLYPTRIKDISTIAKGGEAVNKVLYQRGFKENYVFDSNFLEMNCVSNVVLTEHANRMPKLKCLKVNVVKDKYFLHNSTQNENYIIAIQREDYANLHNWVRHTYNIFLIMIHFKIQPRHLTLLLLDGHPATELDRAWTAIYGQFLRVGHMKKEDRFKKFILGLDESKGPIIDFKNKEVPYLEEFRSYVLTKFHLNSSVKINCTNLKITIIVRRNAVFHPRNVQGIVGRKIFNEAALVNDLMKEFPTACIKPVLMEALPFVSQVDIIRQTDLLIGMHGAGMSHVMFLPQHAAILELFPKNFKNGRPWYLCFQSIANWRSMKYDSWENFDSSLEMPEDFTVLPTDIIVSKARGLVNKICA